MPRQARNTPAGYIYHVTNRASGKLVMLRKEEDFEAIQKVIAEAHEREPMPIYAYSLLGDRWHMVVKPKDDGQLSRFFGWLALTHAVRWRVAHPSAGAGHLYQSRFKAFAVQNSAKLLDVIRFVESAPVRDGEVKKAEAWRWSSLGDKKAKDSILEGAMAAWPVSRPSDWASRVNRPFEEAELAQVETSVARERPYGDDAWVAATVKKLGLEHTVRGRGRPRKVVKEAKPKKSKRGK